MSHITPAITNFLKNIAVFNDREWLHAHKAQYEEAKADFELLVIDLLKGISKFDDLGGVEPKKCIYRLNRDIRFSKDKTPYKTWFGAVLSPHGKKFPGVTYYLHIDPTQGSFVGGGTMCLDKEILQRFRQSLVDKPKAFPKIINDKAFKKTFGDLWGEKLKRVPTGFDAEHENAELLKYKHFGVQHPLTNKVLVSEKNCIPTILKLFKEMKPFIHYVNQFS